MKIKIRGELSLRQLIQCIYEQLLEVEQRYAIHHAQHVTIYMTTTNGCGDVVFCKNEQGEEVFTMHTDGPYDSITEHFDI